LPERVRNRLAEETTKLSAAGAPASWTPPERMHVTLRFLGEIPEDAMVEAARLLRESVAGVRALKLVAQGLGTLPSEGPPRVVTVGVRGEDPAHEESLRLLRRRLNDGARAYGFRPEKGAFVPHVTLARLKGEAGVDLLLKKLGPGVRREFAHFRVEEISLFESTEIFAERAYVPLSTVKL
jgi:2'-5' RNA ligase